MYLYIISVVFFGGMAIGIAFGIAHVGGTLIQVTAYNTLVSFENNVSLVKYNKFYI